jgi:uncharacterized membrane protein YhiD involved in acid resistance
VEEVVMPPNDAIAPTVRHIGDYLFVLAVAAGLGAALGVVRPVRREIVPRSAHIIQAQILLSIVGAIIIVVVAESLARAFAIVGAAGLVCYRARIDDPKDAGVMLVALALGLTTGSGHYLFAVLATGFVIVVLWLLESLEPPARARYELSIAGQGLSAVKPEIERALVDEGAAYALIGSSDRQLHYEVTVPYDDKIRRLTTVIQNIDDQPDISVEWEIRRHKSDK